MTDEQREILTAEPFKSDLVTRAHGTAVHTRKLGNLLKDIGACYADMGKALIKGDADAVKQAQELLDSYAKIYRQVAARIPGAELPTV